MSNIAKMIAIAKRFGGSSGPSEVVILPETELVYTEDMGQPAFAATIQATPKAYTLAKVVYNGAPYDCVVAEQAGSTIFGNADFMKGGDNGKPFLAMTAPNPDGSTLLLCVPLDGASSVTMSITQVESKTAGVFVISVTCDSEKGSDGHYANATMDKTVDEINVAYALGNVVVCRLQINTTAGRHELALNEYMYDEGYDFGPAGGESSYVKSVFIQNNGVVDVW